MSVFRGSVHSVGGFFVWVNGSVMLDEIIRNGAISDTSLRMLVKKIIITERKGKLKIKIQLNATSPRT